MNSVIVLKDIPIAASILFWENPKRDLKHSELNLSVNGKIYMVKANIIVEAHKNGADIRGNQSSRLLL